jgi:uncharacterized membrane protein
MLTFLKTYPLLLVFFLAVDLMWLGWAARDFYQKHLGRFFRDKINWPAALAFYGIYIAGILIFAVLPAVREGAPIRAGVYGMLYGFFTYATYDLTNLATLRDWPGVIVVVDILWGTLLCGMSAVAGYFIAGWMA